MKIYKYTLDLVTGPQHIAIPAPAELLSVQLQNDEIVFWALVDPDAGYEHLDFLIVGTGSDFDATGWTYWGTIQHHGFVWHIFRRPAQ